MSSYETVKDALKADAGLVALVSDGIYADFAPPGAALPYVVYARTDLDIERGLDNSIQLRMDTFHVLSWGATRVQAVNVAEQALGALDAAGLAPEKGEPDDVDPSNFDRVVAWRVLVTY
ncbi:DUF3168 domain-containing protein [Paucibacter sp. R3-3]|uniref:DUF3168 domain-containing protein n=1 Tax=Roseateles agri TaxID=3098619 RepID=A0ABU5DQB7_9BURK|nr:DUF3168 domain-containing protein [Paucibacter sp. R3-3]MDY0748505.1 DUF3168 domain-containing protein [Paucibacter sp. R3-3]